VEKNEREKGWKFATAPKADPAFHTLAKVRLDKLCLVISQMLDAVELEKVDITTHHSLRVTVLSAAIARKLEFSDADVTMLSVAAMFHDSAISESSMAERIGRSEKQNAVMKLHCQLGQRNLEYLPLQARMNDYILYHHERYDGQGPFGKKRGEFSLGAEILSVVDYFDVMEHFNTVAQDSLTEIRAKARALGRAIFYGSFERVLRDAYRADAHFPHG